MYLVSKVIGSRRAWPEASAPYSCRSNGRRNGRWRTPAGVLESHLAVVLGIDTGRERVVTGIGVYTATHHGTDRTDFPIVMQRNKGSASRLESQLASGSSRAEALTDYEHDKHAASAHASRGSLLATLTRFLRAWLGPDVSIIPVAPEHISFVGAAMKMRGYRSFSNYTSRAKEAHIAAGHTWTPRHELEAAQGTRSVT